MMKMKRVGALALAASMMLALTLSIDPAFARGGGGGGRGGGGFSGGSSFRSAPAPARAPSPPPAPARVVTAPPPPPAPVQKAPPPVAQAPAPVTPGFRMGNNAQGAQAVAPQMKTFDASGAKALSAQTSREKFQASQQGTAIPTAKATDTTTAQARTPEHRYNRDAHVSDLRRQLSQERWKTRQLREDQLYGRYRGQPQVFTQSYHDPFGSPFFWMWLMNQNSHSRDQWIYHHQNDLDPARLAELKSRDADLEQRLRAIETQGVARDRTYTPPELKGNEDLAYSQDVVQAAAKAEHSSSNLWLWLGLLAVLGATAYFLIFHYRGWQRWFGVEAKHV